MDITNQVDTIVNNLVRDIETRLNSRVDTLVTRVIEERLNNIDYETKLNWLASAKLDNLISEMELDEATVQRKLDSVADVVVNSVQEEAKRTANDIVRNRLYNDVDVNELVRNVISEELAKRLTSFTFPDRSIPGSAVNPTGLSLTGNNIQGGIIKNFNSSGIEDKSSEVQITLLNEAVVVENKIVTLGLEVKGQCVIDGDLHINGDIPEDSLFYQTLLKHSVKATQDSLSTELFQGYSHVIFELIKEKGLDLNQVTFNGQPLIEGNKLSYGISDTNITRLGIVKDFQTSGEALLSQTLYVTKDRVGINTMEPGHALSVWDQEVELAFSKRQKNTGWLGTPRAQDLVFGANNQDNIVLRSDGTVAVQKMELGGRQFFVSDKAPTTDAPPGSVAFNSAPVPGGAAGWISLGGGTWSRFGTLG
jgi:hypothetical protein